jgi:predicted nucleic-acid-binding protein
MSKKDFLGDTLSLMTGDKPKVGRPVTQTKEITKTSQEGTKLNETRATFILNEVTLERLKAIAYWERKLIKEVINEAIRDYIINYEKIKKAPINPIPKK